MKTLYRHQLDFAMFNGLCGVVFSSGALSSLYGERLLVLTTAWVVWRLPWHPLSNNSIGCTPLLKVSFDGKSWPVPSPPLFGDFIKITIIYFRKFPLLHSLPQSHLPFSSPAESPQNCPICPQSRHKMWSITPSQGDPSVLSNTFLCT